MSYFLFMTYYNFALLYKLNLNKQDEQLQSRVLVKEKNDSIAMLDKDKKSETELDDTEDYLLPRKLLYL